MEEQQNVPQPNWTTWWNHSCYTGIPWLSALHCLQQLQSGACSTSTTQPLSLSRTAQRHQVPRPTRSRHSVLISLIFQWASLVMSVHRLCRCALCFQHTTLQQTPPRNSPSRRFCRCVLPNNPSGVQFHSAFMKTFVKHKPQQHWKLDASHVRLCRHATLFRRVLRAVHPLKPRTTLLQDASTQASPHSAAFADASTQLPLTEFFLGCVYSNDSLDRQPSLPSHGKVGQAHGCHSHFQQFQWW